MSSTDDFFDKIKPHSRIKIAIVTKYFAAWVDIMKIRCTALTYLDLFSGPGIYEEDGTPSTPMRILSIAEEKGILSSFKAYFYESDPEYSEKLDMNLKNHSALGKMNTKPKVYPEEVNRELVPQLPIDDCTFSFVDPHGYHDISAELLNSLVKNWGSDCIFYLSTSGIRRNIDIPSEQKSLTDLFGKKGLEELRLEFERDLDWYVKDRLIIKKLAEAVQNAQKAKLYFLDFGMEFEHIEMVSYYLILISQHHRGFAIMKEIMAKESFSDPDGIPFFIYSKSKLERDDQLQLHFGEKMAKLKSNLCRDFKNKTLKVIDILEKCHMAGYIHTKNNMKDALLALEIEKEVSILPPRDQRPWRKGKPTLADDKTVTFHCR